jgi:hypothetical protein
MVPVNPKGRSKGEETTSLRLATVASAGAAGKSSFALGAELLRPRPPAPRTGAR